MANDTQTLTTLVVVAAALVGGDGTILVQQRPEGKPMAGLWEFPGGKVEVGETPETALIRELEEELGIRVDAAELVPLAFASEAIGSRPMLLLLYLCREWAGEPHPHDGQHIARVPLDALDTLAMPPADGPLVRQLRAQLASGSIR